MGSLIENTTTKVVDEIGKMNFEGNIIPHSWYKSILKESNKPDTIGIIILSDIVYWYRPTVVRDEATGSILKVKKKFKADKLQRSYDQLSEQFGFSKRQVRDAIYRLKKLGLIEIELRNLKVNGRDLNNVLYLEPVPERISNITYLDPYDEKKDTLVRKKVIGGTKISSTNTEITTENTTENTIDAEDQASSLLMQSQNQKDESIKINLKGDDIGIPPSSEDSGDIMLDVPIRDIHLGHLSKESKRKVKLEEKFKNKSVPDIIAWDKERVSENKKNKGGAKVKKSSPSSSVIIARFQELYKDLFTDTPPMIEIKHKVAIKKMVEHYGFDYTKAMLEEMFKNWVLFKRECKIHSTPNLTLLYSFRDYFHERVRSRIGDDRPLDEF